jgi:uncharacterized membrane protein YkoI
MGFGVPREAGRAPAYGAQPYSAQPYNAPAYNALAARGDLGGQQERARSGVQAGQLAPLGAVIAGIRQRIPGRQLDTGLESIGGRPVYRVRWITHQGRRMDILVDAASGAILSKR